MHRDNNWFRWQRVVELHIVLVSQALDSVSKGQRKLDLAQRLTGALSSENDRWADNVVQLRADMELLTGDVLLAASFIRYIPCRITIPSGKLVLYDCLYERMELLDRPTPSATVSLFSCNESTCCVQQKFQNSFA